MYHKYSTVKGLQHCSGGAGEKVFKAVCMIVNCWFPQFPRKNAGTKGSVPNPFGQDCRIEVKVPLQDTEYYITFARFTECLFRQICLFSTQKLAKLINIVRCVVTEK